MRHCSRLLPVFLLGCSAEAATGASPPPAEVRGSDAAYFGGAFSPGDLAPAPDPPAVAPDLATSTAETPPPPPTSPSDSIDASTEGSAADAGDVPSAPAPPTPPFDPGEGGICPGPLGPGDLVIDELMVESVAGAGDHGEWLEVRSLVGCAVDLRGLRGDAPNGAKVRSFDIGEDAWIPAFGTFVIADSTNAAINHDLPGTVIPWSGQPGDVLRNKGGTVSLEFSGTTIDSVTYPSMTLTVGCSIAFPSDCAPDRRTDWTAWQASSLSWSPGFSGTPNAPNDDVQCPR